MRKKKGRKKAPYAPSQLAFSQDHLGRGEEWSGVEREGDWRGLAGLGVGLGDWEGVCGCVWGGMDVCVTVPETKGSCGRVEFSGSTASTPATAKP